MSTITHSGHRLYTAAPAGYPELPELPAGCPFQHGAGAGGVMVPAKVHGWAWSSTFGRWSALVTMPDGWYGFTYPWPYGMEA